MTWVISVTNDGPQTTAGVVVRDQLPDLVDESRVIRSVDGGMGQIKVGDTVELTIIATVVVVGQDQHFL